MKSIKSSITSFMVFVLSISFISAQQHLDPEYVKVTNDRAAKIVSKLNIDDVEKADEVTAIIGQQYRNLSKLHDARDLKIEKVTAVTLVEEKRNKKIDIIKSKSDLKIKRLHTSYLKALAVHLNEEEITGVKDGMTYGVVPLTYSGYLDMLPNLTESQKQMIYNNLVEARELAMDAGSSKEKHGWFGKYKGRINNKLSAEGYDLHKESKAWHKRVKEQKNQSKK